MRADGKSVTLAEAIARASADRKLMLYRQLRSEHSGTADGQLLLAKWCRKEGFTDEARLHWWTLLSKRSDDRDAIRDLHLQSYQGTLMTQEEITQVKKAKQAAAEWTPKLKRIQQAIKHGDAAERDTAIQELESIVDPRALPLITKMFSVNESTIALRLIKIIAKMPAEEAASHLFGLRSTRQIPTFASRPLTRCGPSQSTRTCRSWWEAWPRRSK